MSRFGLRMRVFALMLVAFAVIGVGAALALAPEKGRPGSMRSAAVRPTLDHLSTLAQITSRNGGTRLAGSPGDRAAVVYVARRLRAAGYAVRLQNVRATSPKLSTVNVLASLPAREGSRVVMAGAHLDSVQKGPGINDNGSGVAALLHSAEVLAADRGRRRGLRLGFWGAEEQGKFGSLRYVRGLSATERKRIPAYLNLDMLGSPNAGRFMYWSARGRRAATVARGVFKGAGVTVERTDIGNASDHAPFERAGVPVLGFFSGAGQSKTVAQRQRWGGKAGASFDAVYHTRNDRLGGIDRRSLSEFGEATTGTLKSLTR